MNIGRDVLGTMANTLILAYIGSSLSVVLLLSVYSSSVLYLFNREMIVVEILQSLGSFGLLFAMPLTSLVSAFLYTEKRSLSKINFESHRSICTPYSLYQCMYFSQLRFTISNHIHMPNLYTIVL